MASEQSKVYDFIVIGAGPAGSVVASQLSRTPQKPSVLLVEAGPAHDDLDTSLRIQGKRVLSCLQPERVWSYQSVPNPDLNDRVLPLVRGKGLGGGSVANFGAWTESTKQDWHRLACMVGDDAWDWANVKRRFNALTTHHCTYPDVKVEHQKYFGKTEGSYGTSGPLHVGYPEEPEQELLDLVDTLERSGVPYRSEANSDTSTGLFLHPHTFHRGTRSTAADLCHDSPANLEIITETLIRRVLVEQSRAVGVEAVDGRVFRASLEVIISAGAMDSPKILMHSGIGPADQLHEFGIPLTHANASVGQDFQDHLVVLMSWQEKEEYTKRPAFFRDTEAQKAALRQWELRRTGPFASMGHAAMSLHGPKESLETAEFAALPEEERNFLSQPEAPPFYEIIWGFSTYPLMPDPNDITATFSIFLSLHYAQSRGSFTLQSRDATVPLAFQTGMLSHPFDKRQAVEAMRKVLSMLRTPEIAKRIVRPLNAPASDSEGDILAFWRQNGESCYHGGSTCKMGAREIEDHAVVDHDMKVFGVTGLRVVDNSIWPRLLSMHVQAAAYQAAMAAVEKIIAEHRLAILIGYKQ